MSPALLHPNDAGAAAAAPSLLTPLGALLTGRVLHDGELVLLVLKPSRWFVLLTSLRFIAAAMLLMILVAIYNQELNYHAPRYWMAGAMLVAGRLTWATLQWIARLYILTDLRVLRISGVFTPEIVQCPLRKVAGVDLSRSVKERLTRTGTILVHATDASCDSAAWQMVRHPHRVRQQILDAIRRARP